MTSWAEWEVAHTLRVAFAAEYMTDFPATKVKSRVYAAVQSAPAASVVENGFLTRPERRSDSRFGRLPKPAAEPRAIRRISRVMRGRMGFSPPAKEQ